MKALKYELAALDRKITAALTPKHDDTTDGEGIKSVEASKTEKADNQSHTADVKSSLVAEPIHLYRII